MAEAATGQPVFGLAPASGIQVHKRVPSRRPRPRDAARPVHVDDHLSPLARRRRS